MSRKDYDLLAALLLRCKPEKLHDPQFYTHWQMMCRKLSHGLQKDNSLFKRNMFLVACGFIAEEI